MARRLGRLKKPPSRERAPAFKVSRRVSPSQERLGLPSNVIMVCSLLAEGTRQAGTFYDCGPIRGIDEIRLSRVVVVAFTCSFRPTLPTAFTYRAGCKELDISKDRNAGPLKCNALFAG